MKKTETKNPAKDSNDADAEQKTDTNHIKTRFCTRAEAESLFAWASIQHGGGWIGHSRTAARVAETIARHYTMLPMSRTAHARIAKRHNQPFPSSSSVGLLGSQPPVEPPSPRDLAKPLPVIPVLDPNRAYIYALLHDIGRYEGDTKLHHIIAGYNLLMKHGYTHEARICLTHSCYSMKLAKNPDYWPGVDDPAELKFMTNFINTVKLDDYDRLIQLADLMSLESGVYTVNDRFCDSVSRYHLSNPSEDLRARQELKAYFDKKIGINVYDLFHDEIVRNTVG